jgi:hypothetical protein
MQVAVLMVTGGGLKDPETTRNEPASGKHLTASSCLLFSSLSQAAVSRERSHHEKGIA